MISLQQDLENPRLKLTLLEDTKLSPASLPTYNSNMKMFFEWAEISDVAEFVKVKDKDLQILMDMYVKHLSGKESKTMRSHQIQYPKSSNQSENY